MSENKAELVWKYTGDPCSTGYVEMERGTTPHYVISAAGVPNNAKLNAMLDGYSLTKCEAEAMIAVIRHVLDAMGLREVE